MFVLFTILVVLIVLAALPWRGRARARPSSVTAARLDLTDDDLAILPDRVRLARTPLRRFPHGAEVRAASAPLGLLGFRRAGNYAVVGWPGLRVRLLVNRTESLIAAIHDHEAAGVWIDVTSRHWEGGQITHTTLDGRGLEPRPGHFVLRVPGVAVEELVRRARADRSREHLRRVRRDRAPALYEEGYAEWIAWRRGRLYLPPRRAADRPREAA